MALKKKKRILFSILAVFLLLTGISFGWLSLYDPAEETALAALVSDPEVTVEKTAYGYFLDGSGSDDLLIFYPGGKVDERAYAPLLRRLAEEGVDAALLKVPFHLSVFSMNKADAVDVSSYKHVWTGGHSLGGVIAGRYAASHPDRIEGVILLASYADKPLPQKALLVLGTKDQVVKQARYEQGKNNLQGGYQEVLIPGGNHAGFGCYGAQKGDGTAEITPEAQQEETAEQILSFMRQ
ncbi:MAG: alpha/beta hydrolase [Solobacterium sp.]|nr:alpha/beta hydrolase [Solobacterium sp.]